MTQGVARLKELLFDSESQTIADLDQRLSQALGRVAELEGLSGAERAERGAIAQRVDQLFETAGTRERFSNSVASVLDDALREAEVHNHEDVAQAMAPLVVKTIRTELRNSQDELVEVLYPITGRMVKSYVASAMRDMVRELNRRVEQNGMMLRIRSITSGKSVAELAIAESEHLKVEEIFLIRRGSGTLVARWPAGPELSNSDIHMSGVVSAINDFATHAFQEDGGNLRTFELDDFNVYLRASPLYLVAAKCRGIAPTGVSGIFDEEFLNLLDRIGSRDEAGSPLTQAAPQQLAPLASSVEEKTSAIYADNDRAGLAFSPLKALLFLIAVPLFAGLIWWGYTTIERNQVEDTAQRVLDNIPEIQGFPTALDVGYRGHTVKVSGLAPDKLIAGRVDKGLVQALPNSAVVTKLAILPKRESVNQEQLLAGLRSEIAAVEMQTKRRGVQLALERAGRQMAKAKQEVERVRSLADASEHGAALSEVDASVTRITQAIDTYTRVARATSTDLPTLQNMTTPLHEISQGTGAAATTVFSFIEESYGRPSPSHVTSAPPDVSIAAEQLAAEAQRLASSAASVAQALLIKRSQPVPQPATTVTGLERLQAFTARNAIFFSNGTDFREQEKAEAKMDRLVALMADTDANLRVAGYTDERGGVGRNNPLAQSRADKVADTLVARGLDRSRLIIVGRANALSLSDSTGPTSANRRVQFEVALIGE